MFALFTSDGPTFQNEYFRGKDFQLNEQSYYLILQCFLILPVPRKK